MPLLALLAAPSAATLPCDTGAQTYKVCPAAWEFVGPSTYTDGATTGYGDDEDDADDRAVGPVRYERADDGDDGDDAGRRRFRAVRDSLASQSAVQVVASAKPGVWFSGTVNGGVWRSKDIYASPLAWEPVLDSQPVSCAAIAALEVAGFDPSFVLAGCGGPTSSEMGTNPTMVNTGDWGGVMASHDGGDTWGMTSFPANYYVTGIKAITAQTIVVSARNHFFNQSDGGVWVSGDGGKTWTRTLSRPTFFLAHQAEAGLLIAAHPRDPAGTVSVSTDDGATWADWSDGIDWHGREAYYPTLAIGSGKNPTVFVGALTGGHKVDWTDSNSATFWRAFGSDAPWAEVANQPMPLDPDHMPKDRMGLLVDPTDDDLLYICGNAGAVAWRVQWKTGSWTKLWGASMGSPHSDNRNLAWEPQKGSLILTSDGGQWILTNPRGSGKWSSLNGGSAAMEFVTAAWDSRLSRWVGGAQDNGCQMSPHNATAGGVAAQVAGGDGTLTEVDNAASPSRLFCASYLFGGLGFNQGTKRISVPASSWFARHTHAVSYFITPWTLNTQDPTKLVVWVNGTSTDGPGWWEIEIPYSVSSSSDIKKPSAMMLGSPGPVTTFVAGGYTSGKSDPSVLVGMNGQHLYHRSAASAGKLMVRDLPARFAEPVIWTKTSDCPRKISGLCVGPISHGKPQFLAVSPADSGVVAVTGWPSVERNEDGKEGVWLSRDAGATWADVTGDLGAATATTALARPSGIAMVDFPSANASALIAGTVNGPFVMWTDAPGTWARLGGCAGVPKVLTMGISYEAYSDTLVASTFGRGVYILKGAKAALLKARAQQQAKSCDVPPPRAPESSAAYLPPQQ